MSKTLISPQFNLKYIIRLTRIKGWWDKLIHLIGTTFLLLIYTDPITIDMGGYMTYLAVVVCLLIGGYAINDAADFLPDKKTIIKSVPQQKHSLILAVIALSTSLIIIFTITKKPLPLLITAATILIGVEYSLPPIRFKERGIWGIIIGSATQRPAIFLIFIAIIWKWNWLSAVLMIWLFLGGVLGMLGHQIKDYQNDLKSRIQTFVVRHGQRKAIQLCMVNAMLLALITLTPFIFVPVTEALPIMSLLAALSSVYAVKGLRSIGRLMKK